MARTRLTVWPIEQRQWVERRSQERGLPLSTVIQLLLEQAMAADPVTQAAEPEPQK